MGSTSVLLVLACSGELRLGILLGHLHSNTLSCEKPEEVFGVPEASITYTGLDIRTKAFLAVCC